MQLAVSPDVTGTTGVCSDQLVEAPASARACDEEARAKPWALGLELTGLAERS